MDIIYRGKTKDLYKRDDGNILFQFKDDITGSDGVADTGGDEVVGQVSGMGKNNVQCSELFFEKIIDAGIPTHYVESSVDEATMVVKPAEFFGEGLEIITRYKAVGSFIRRYGKYAQEGQDLDGYVEVTLKDDERHDPPITKEGLVMLGILDEEQYDKIIELNQQSTDVIKELLEDKGLTLYDIKLEFGVVDGEIVLIDEISGGNMRVYKDDEYIEPLDLVNYLV